MSINTPIKNKSIKVTINIFFLQKNSYISLISSGPLNIRYYSTKNDNNNVRPAVIYLNADVQVKEIMRENKGKSGVYR